MSTVIYKDDPEKQLDRMMGADADAQESLAKAFSINNGAPLSAGQLLSARERGAVGFRDKIGRQSIGGSGPKRSADLITGYKVGWDEAINFLRAQGAIR